MKKSYQVLQEFWSEFARLHEERKARRRRPSADYFPWHGKSSVTTGMQITHFVPVSRSSVDEPPLRFSVENFQIWFDDTHVNGNDKIDTNANAIPTLQVESLQPTLPRHPGSPVTQAPKVADLVNAFEHGHGPNDDEQLHSDHQEWLQKPPERTRAISLPTNSRPIVDGFNHVVSSSPQTTPKSAPAATQQWPPKDLGDVALKLRNDETLFERRQKYQSMFKDAPLYQMYNDRATRRDNATKTIVRISSDEISQTNSLEFQDNGFAPIDGEDHTGAKPDPELLVAAAFDLWKQRAAEATAQNLPPSPKRERSKNREMRVLDNRARSKSPEARSPTQNSMVKRTPSDPVEMQRFAAQIAGTGPKRVSWSNMPQVVERGLANNLSSGQRKLQEALFEIMTSEASYFRSLNVLIEVFYRAPCMQAGSEGALVTHTEKHHLFSNILEIIMTSENFLRAMEGCFRKDPWLTSLFEIVYKHSETDFQAYVTYVQNQSYQNRTLCKLRRNPQFLEATKKLQTHPDCAFLDLNSFLLLPMQRVTRLRLLSSTVLHYAPKNSVVYQSGLVALASLERLLSECDSKKLYMEQKERLMELTIRFEYKLDAKSVATESRRLIKEGELRLATVTKQTGSAFQRRLSGIRRQKVISASLFLFNDLLIIAKQRSNKKLMVDDSCPLTAIKTQVTTTPPGAVITRYYSSRSSAAEKDAPNESISNELKEQLLPIITEMDGFAGYPFTLFIESPEHPKAEYKLQAKSLSERERWLDALCPTQFAASDEALIRDCPQLLANRSYSATAGDELELKQGDTAYLLIRLSDGWCKAMLPDGRKGWVPTSVCEEMNDATIKRDNMKNCLLMEEARNAYKRRKAKEHFIEFPKIQDLKK